MHGPLSEFILRPIKSHPVVGAICFGWSAAWFLDELVHRNISRPAEVPVLQSDDDDDTDSIAETEGCSGQPRRKDFRGWPDRPCLLRWNPDVKQRPASDVQESPARGLPINNGRPIKVDTPLFEGSVYVWVAGLPTTPEGFRAEVPPPAPQTRITLQGRFKRRLPFDNLVTGQEFSRQAKHLPVQWLVEKVLFRVAKHLSPSTEIGPLNKPKVVTPVVSNTQYMHVAAPGSEVDPAGPPVEDLTLLGAPFVDAAGKPLPAEERVKLLGNSELRQSLHVDTDNVWTFTIYQHQVDLSKYELSALKRWDMADILDGQPFQFMVKDAESGQYLFNLQLWHERLLPYAQRQQRRQQRAEQAKLPPR